ncbi:MAG: hypothetical protein R3E01_33905 [Pirellulaceae bacterium]
MNEPITLEDLELDGDTISFSVTRKFNENQFTVSYSGKLDGDKIDGDSKATFNGQPREFPWNAERKLTADDVVGDWNLKLESPNGPIESRMTLEKKDDALTGTYHSSVFGDHSIKDIEIKEQSLQFHVTFDTDNGDITVNYEVKPTGNAAKGTAKADFGGQESEMSLTATRQPPAKQPN